DISESDHSLRPPPYRQVLALAWPVLLQQLLIFLVGLSDRYLAGNFPPPDREKHIAYQAAQPTAPYLTWVISSYTVVVRVGATALVARFVGAREWPLAIHATNQSLVLAAAFGLLASMCGLFFLPEIVALLQLDGDAAVYAADYLQPTFWLLVFQMVESAGIACLVGAGDTRTGMFVLGGVAVINFPLAWGFYHGVGPLPELGFAGIALGTAVSH